MSCPFPDCADPAAAIETRYGSREVSCPSCGRFKIADDLWAAAAQSFRADPLSVAALRQFIQDRNREDKSPWVTAENWRILGREG